MFTEEIKTGIVDYFKDLVKITQLNSPNEFAISLPWWLADGDSVTFFIVLEEYDSYKLTDDGDLINIHCSTNPQLHNKIKNILIKSGFEVDEDYAISYKTTKEKLIPAIYNFANIMIKMSHLQ